MEGKKTSQSQKEATLRYMHKNERIECVFSTGTKERIKALGYKPATFIKDVITAKLNELEQENSTQ